MLRPLWALVHASLLMLGLWLLWQGRQPALLAQLGRGAAPVQAAGWQPIAAPGVGTLHARPALQATLAGGLWFAWPCGLLQSAVMVSALSSSALGGAAAMAAFAAASSVGLLLAPLVWRWLGRGGSGRAERWALRGAGLLMALMSGWALSHGLWERFAAYCATL
jgi:sulfite exporter TauE/SafE